MKLAIHTIGKDKGSDRKRKRVGRGNASGHGTYSGRGLKGQKSRSGVSRGRLKRLGMKQVLLRTPKKRGFTSLKSKKEIVNIITLNSEYKEGETVTPQSLYKKGLISTTKTGVKILGLGKISVKNLNFIDVDISQSAKELIIKNGGKISYSREAIK